MVCNGDYCWQPELRFDRRQFRKSNNQNSDLTEDSLERVIVSDIFSE